MGDPGSAIFGTAYTQWGAAGLVVALGIWLIIYLSKQIEKRDVTITALNQRVYDQNQQLLTVYQSSAEKLVNVSLSTNANVNQLQQLATTLQLLVDRMLAK